ncbi:hypothetical protein [Bdellovibrio reynosensis]|uniref:Bdellovibrio beta-sandwich domain-containing protein n=1 Tax=Bdellovibrio reynosensis TaxID=2835041 RepID=A0ABY4C5P8_9BACT|nr:hypothetical protein [Bdellovibrio reynosensis]UOF00277.1 hypothetical protein MNR06_11250 [Bdellovibrio reynosensis]
MRKYKSKILFLLMCCPFASLAAPVCVSNFKEFEQKKSGFPKAVQSMPTVFTIDSFVAKGGVRVRVVENKFKLEGSVDTLKGFYNDDAYVKSICSSGNLLVLTFENGKTQEVEINGNKAKIEGGTFTKSTPAEFAKLVNEVRRKKKLPMMPDVESVNPGVR